MKKVIFKVIFLLSVVSLLILGNACKKTVEWPTAAEQGGGGSNNVNPGDTLDSIAVFTLTGAPPNTTTSPSSIKTAPFKDTTTVNYSYVVSFKVFSASDVNYTSPIYANSTSLVLANTNPTEVIVPIHYNGCILRSQFQASMVTRTNIPKYAVSGGQRIVVNQITYDTTVIKGFANGSQNCELFNVGKTRDGNSHMIFNVTAAN